MGKTLGLVMTGGGARGAYQAGVLKRIAELKRVQTRGNPFPIIGGASAGAINGSSIAAGSDDFSGVTNLIAHLWSSLKPSDIFRCDFMAQAQNSITWILDLSFGGLAGGGNARSLLDSTPLLHYLRRHLDCERIQKNISKGHLYAIAISATNYHSGKSYLFIQGRKDHPIWNRSRRVTVSTRLTPEHICASAAIPLVFHPVRLPTETGSAFFGDGCVRLQQPLSPVIRLGAEKIVAIGVRGDNSEHTEESAGNGREPSVAEIMGVLFNTIFLDHLATDIDHLERLNRLLAEGKIRQNSNGGRERMRPLKSLLIAPTIDLSQIAEQHGKDMPRLIQFFVNSLGRDTASCADIMSYLLFTSKYTSELVRIGYEDASSRIDEIEDFLYSA